MTEGKLFPFNIGFCLLLTCSGALAREARVAVVVGNHEVITLPYTDHPRFTNAIFRVVYGEVFLARKRMATRVL